MSMDYFPEPDLKLKKTKKQNSKDSPTWQPSQANQNSDICQNLFTFEER